MGNYFILSKGIKDSFYTFVFCIFCLNKYVLLSICACLISQQEEQQQSGLDSLLRADRQSLLSEIEALRTSISALRQEHQELQTKLSESLSQQEEQASSVNWKLQREGKIENISIF